MARGQILSIPTNTAVLISTLSKEQKQSVSILNPNDGVCYVKMNGPASSSVASWDWKIPSQSYCQLPGPWESLGVFYVDQSGSGRSAEVNVYELDSQISVPSFLAIGRAVQAAGSAVDISQGTQPSNPPASTVRLWADGSGNLHFLESNGTDQTVIDSSNYNTMITMIGDVIGPLNNTIIRLRNNSNIYAFDQSNNQHGLLNAGGGYHLSYGMESGWLWRNYLATYDVMALTNTGNLSLTRSGAQIIFASGAYINDYGGGYVGISQLTVTPGVSALAGVNVNGTANIYSGLNVTGNIGIMNAGALYWPNNGNQQIYPTGSGLQLNTFLNTSGDVNANGRLYTPNYLIAPTVYLNTSAAAPYIQQAGAAIRYWASGVHSFEGTDTGGLGNVQAAHFTTYSGTYYFVNTSVAITWNGSYLNHSHSIQFNTTGNQILWPNGSYISGNAGYVQGSQRALKSQVTKLKDSDLLAKVSDPNLPVSSYYWNGETKPNVGFIADDIAKVLPNNIVRNDNGEPNGYNPQELTAILWGAVRELANRVSVLEGAA
jgi:hypothetical protein